MKWASWCQILNWLLPFLMHASIIWEFCLLLLFNWLKRMSGFVGSLYHFSLLEDFKSCVSMCVCVCGGSNVTHQKPLIYFNGTICPCVSRYSSWFFFHHSLSRCRKYMFLFLLLFFFFFLFFHFIYLSIISFLFFGFSRVSID